MPVKVQDSLPAIETLKKENIFVMSEQRAITQDIRPLKILLLNLMPTKIVTETQIVRLISNSVLQVEVDLMTTASYEAKNVSQKHLLAFYKKFDEVKDKKYDGLIITGAPVEMMEFEEVDYWQELCEIMEWAKKHVFSTLFICWGAQAGLYYNYGIKKYPLPKKMFGVFEHEVLDPSDELVRGFDEVFFAPHSRHTEVRKEDIEKIDDLKILSVSKDAGVFIVVSKDGKNVFVTGHTEYDCDTLKSEYVRDVNKGLPIEIPRNYFIDNDPNKLPQIRWRAHANLLIGNWLNYYVYQQTPYDLSQL